MASDLDFTGGFRWTERILNNSGTAWTDFRVVLSGQGTFFTDSWSPFQASITDPTGPSPVINQLSTDPPASGNGTNVTLSGGNLIIDFVFATPIANGAFLDIHIPIQGLNTAGGTFTLTETPTALSTTVACTGFDSPFDTTISIKKKVQRAIPLRMQLNSDEGLVTDLNIPGAAPVVDVSFSAGGGPAVDVTTLLEPVGQSSEGNAFTFDVSTGHWVFNLGTKPFSSAGTYTVTAKSADTSYVISPPCSGQFVRSP